VTRIVGVALQAVVVAALTVFLLGPLVLVFILSFSDDQFIAFPPENWGIRQYRTMVDSELWTQPLLRSLLIAAIVAVVSTVVGVLAVLGMARSRVPGRNLLLLLAVGPLIVPGVVYAIGAYQVFSDVGLVGTRAAFVVSHTVLALPFVLLIVGAAMARVPRELELAAMSLGAGKPRALRDVTLRFLAPAIVASALFAFSLSLNEVVVSNFLASIDYTTLPVAIYASLKIAVDPVVMAISSTLAVVSCVLILISMALRRSLR
jgi:ABC-type spermidine/putrescine transport system permease subunit II